MTKKKQNDKTDNVPNTSAKEIDKIAIANSKRTNTFLTVLIWPQLVSFGMNTPCFSSIPCLCDIQVCNFSTRSFMCVAFFPRIFQNICHGFCACSLPDQNIVWRKTMSNTKNIQRKIWRRERRCVYASKRVFECDALRYMFCVWHLMDFQNTLYPLVFVEWHSAFLVTLLTRNSNNEHNNSHMWHKRTHQKKKCSARTSFTRKSSFFLFISHNFYYITPSSRTNHNIC